MMRRRSSWVALLLAALREMQRGGYRFHPVWFNLPRQLQRLDVDAMRAQLGLLPLR